jgi:hypothetical protein
MVSKTWKLEISKLGKEHGIRWKLTNPNLFLWLLMIPYYLGSIDINYIIFRNVENFQKNYK